MAHHRPIDKEFEEADDTGVLVLSSRNLRNFPVVPGELCDFNDLLEADFSSNRFDHVPHEVCDFKELVRLTFYRNLLRSVPEDLNRLENLKDLNLSRNLLETIPVGLSHMNLHSLDLSNNRLVSLPIELGCMKQLRYLNLSCNRLPDLPSSIVDLTALQHLDLHRNQLKELPDDIHMLALRYLDISCNRVTALPNTLRHIENTLKIFKMADNPVESPPTHVCVRGLMHIVKWMEGMEKHGSDPHLLSVSSLSSREASLARRSKAKRQSNSRSFIDSSPGENGILNLDEVTNLVNSSLGRGPPPLTKEDGEITPTHTSSPMHWSVAQFRNSPGSVMSDQSKEEYREAAHKLYMQQERQKNRNLRRKRSSSPIQATAKAAVAMAKQQSGSTDFNSLPRRSSKEEMIVTQSSPSSGGTKSLGGSPRVAPARSLPGERHPRPGSWNSHVKVTSSPILPSKYALPANEKPASEDGGSSKGGGESEEELRKKQSPPTAPKPDPVVHRNVSSEARPRAQAEETHKKPPPLESAVAAVPPSSVSNRESHQNHPVGSLSVHRPELSPAPQSDRSDRSDSVTPTNELADEESLTPRSRVGKDPGQTLAEASLKLEQEIVSTKQAGTVESDGLNTRENPASNGVVDVGRGVEGRGAVGRGVKVRGVEGRGAGGRGVEVRGVEGRGAVGRGVEGRGAVGKGAGGRGVEGGEGRGTEKDQRFSLQERDMIIETLEASPKLRRPLSSASDASDVSQKDSTWPRSVPPRKKKEKDVFRFLKEHDTNYTVRRQEFQMSRVIEKCRTVREKIETLLSVELAEDIGEWVADGVVPCQLVKKLHPQLMPTYHSPVPGKELSRGRKTVNIANFIAACRQLHVPEEELCSAGDIIELKDPVRVVTCLQRVLESADIMVMSP